MTRLLQKRPTLTTGSLCSISLGRRIRRSTYNRLVTKIPLKPAGLNSIWANGRYPCLLPARPLDGPLKVSLGYPASEPPARPEISMNAKRLPEERRSERFFEFQQ